MPYLPSKCSCIKRRLSVAHHGTKLPRFWVRLCAHNKHYTLHTRHRMNIMFVLLPRYLHPPLPTPEIEHLRMMDEGTLCRSRRGRRRRRPHPHLLLSDVFKWRWRSTHTQRAIPLLTTAASSYFVRTFGGVWAGAGAANKNEPGARVLRVWMYVCAFK